jgi:SAM-dependent methyltransferase
MRHPGRAKLPSDPGRAAPVAAYHRPMARYDGIAEWYDEDFLGDFHDPVREATLRLLGEGPGRLLDLGCGTGAQSVAFREAGWHVTGVDTSEDMLRRAQARGLDIVQADAGDIPFEDSTFDAVCSLWTHTDLDDFGAAVAEGARVLRPGSPFVYGGAHPCFVGPHSRFISAKGLPALHPGYLQEGRYGQEAAGVGPDGLRAKVGGVHLTLGGFLQSFLHAGLTLERFEELGSRPYPAAIVLRWLR